MSGLQQSLIVAYFELANDLPNCRQHSHVGQVIVVLTRGPRGLDFGQRL